jgi:hypothetical protein
MKLLCLFLLVSGLLPAQTPWPRIDEGFALGRKLIFQVSQNASNDDVFTAFNLRLTNSLGHSRRADILRHVETTQTISATPVVIGTAATDFSAVYPMVAPFYSYFAAPEAIYNPLSRQRSAAAAHAELSTVQPAAPPDPQMIFLDGFGAGLIAFDMTTLSAVSQTSVPTNTGPFGIRPNATGAANEVWVLNSGFELSSGLNEVSVVDLGSQSLVTNIVTPSIQAAVPVGIVFTNDGATAFEALKYDSPDSSGNNGALVVFDAIGRTVTSTMLLKFVPAALLMSLDGLTAYILSNTGTIVYYDVLSGTADLTVSTYPPGSNAGYPGNGSAVYIHPDGARLFWNVGVYLTVFDLTTRTVTNQFNSGLPTTVGRTFSLSQDGSLAFFSDQQGDVAILDTYYGTILAAFNLGTASSIFGGPPMAP